VSKKLLVIRKKTLVEKSGDTKNSMNEEHIKSVTLYW